MDSIASYVAKDAQQAENIVQRVLPRLQHANGAVVLSAVKVTCFGCRGCLTCAELPGCSVLVIGAS